MHISKKEKSNYCVWIAKQAKNENEKARNALKKAKVAIKKSQFYIKLSIAYRLSPFLLLKKNNF